MVRYCLSDVHRGFRWLGHQSYTELGAFHPAYRQGGEWTSWNRRHNAFPKIHYVKSLGDVTGFVRRYAGTHLVCWSLNPRESVLRAPGGHPRSTRNREVAVSQNLLLDFDFQGERVTVDRIASFEHFASQVDTYCRDQGFATPARAFSGRGYHLLLAYPPVLVRDHPDIAARLGHLRDELASTFREQLARLEVSVDRTQGLAQRVKVYGTAKLGHRVLSRFYASRRVEDVALRDYLLGLELPRRTTNEHSTRDRPAWLARVLARDELVRDLWNGEGKQTGDTSRSGFDFSLIQRLARLGYTHPEELATVLSARGDGAARRKGPAYIRRTIANALKR